ncbi:uncharacterized protein BDCG_04224 [Blastomyces dermatitidis ER-3]|uniref:Uncharacterized protein n=1 Tax=Ajellomyces dermatitidis (strain ER-3 / ATCC MYA-2586) TaxID=559297 RepID=A0ABP2F2E9_AJEDR|nr:uncharacterized protein BDCG_04224 [Blastomyces dermatitidis ER-3]EEQ89104.2 hypothetical protein BDCG_04224 [Blastomyces dermatitidis ER-3]EQL31738.1 hypothetical protein BDFG_05967 [Blastomyces dermatitidis ATCC 26199]
MDIFPNARIMRRSSEVGPIRFFYLVHRPPLWMMANQGLVPQIRHDAPGIPQEAKSERFQNRSKFAAPWQQDSNTANTC